MTDSENHNDKKYDPKDSGHGYYEKIDLDHLEDAMEVLGNMLDTSKSVEDQFEKNKEINIPVRFALFIKHENETGQYHTGTATHISYNSLKIKTSVRVPNDTLVNFFGTEQKRFSGQGRIYNVSRSGQWYFIELMFLKTDFGDGHDERRHTRKFVNLPFQFMVKKGRPLSQGIILDLSSSGMRFKCEYKMPKDVLILTILDSKKNTSEKIIRPAKVVWVKKYDKYIECGASFIKKPGDK